jgi:hypothetical protein
MNAEAVVVPNGTEGGNESVVPLWKTTEGFVLDKVAVVALKLVEPTFLSVTVK